MPTPTGGPSLVDIVARQLLSLHAQTNALQSALAALTDQTNAALEVVKAMQEIEALRASAATVRAGAEDSGPKMPPVFGNRAKAEDAPPLPTVPTDLASSLNSSREAPNG